MKELKPCPFCGGPAAIIRHTYIGYEGATFQPSCLRCFAELPKYRYETLKDAFDAWNRRAPEVSE